MSCFITILIFFYMWIAFGVRWFCWWKIYTNRNWISIILTKSRCFLGLFELFFLLLICSIKFGNSLYTHTRKNYHLCRLLVLNFLVSFPTSLQLTPQRKNAESLKFLFFLIQFKDLCWIPHTNRCKKCYLCGITHAWEETIKILSFRKR